jgi:hypothetical protein
MTPEKRNPADAGGVPETRLIPGGIRQDQGIPTHRREQHPRPARKALAHALSQVRRCPRLPGAARRSWAILAIVCGMIRRAVALAGPGGRP